MQKTIEAEEESKYVQPRILRSQYNEITRIVGVSSGYSNEVDFIRQAIREKIERYNR